MSDNKTPRPGSMLAAEVKANKKFRWVVTAIFALVFSALYLDFPSTYFYDYQVRSGFGFDVASWISLGIGVTFVWLHQWFEDKFIGSKNGWLYPTVLLASIAFGVCFAAGFDFALAGIEPGVTS